MKFKESFSLIVDNHIPDDYSVPVAFMKSFGLKCDCVGWTTITLDSEEKFKLIQEMRKKADEQGLKLRCQNYTKEYFGYDADWYYIAPKTSVKNDDWEWDDESPVKIKGYKIPKGSQVFRLPYHIGVSEKFVDACKQLDLTGADFAWITDKGRFDALAYFYILPEKGFRRYTLDYGDEFEKPKKYTPAYKRFLKNCRQVDSDGSHMTEIAESFHKFYIVDLPKLLDQKEAPDTDFAYAGTDALIRKSAAEALIANGVLKWSDLMPAVFFDEKTHDRLIRVSEMDEYMPDFIRETQAKAYEKWKKKTRPAYEPKEKDAIKMLRSAKKEMPDSYEKALKKAILETLVDEPFSWLAPYYKVSNGGAINDEIDFLPYEAVEEATAEFLEELHEDEIVLADMPELESAVVFASAANGDAILLNADGSVMRYDHEDPYLSNEWETLAQFFFDEIEVE